jgi:uncharacterized protein (TIGR02246 family)
MKQSMQHDTNREIVNLIGAWAAAWNTHEIEQARMLVADNVNFVTVAGLWLRGSTEFLAYHREIHYAQMRHSRWTNLGYEVTPVRDDLYLVHLEWTIAGDRDPDGTPRDRRYGLFTWLTERRADRGRILAAHNSNLRPGLRHRLSGANLNHPSN